MDRYLLFNTAAVNSLVEEIYVLPFCPKVKQVTKTNYVIMTNCGEELTEGRGELHKYKP
jgi:hypothetical protein